jgi:hypothetical protein
VEGVGTVPEVGWNTETLKELLDIRFASLEISLERRFHAIESEMNERFESQDRATLAALKSAQSAVDKAEHLADNRATMQNNWRESVTEFLAEQRGSKTEASDVWARWAVLVVSAGTITTLAVTIITLFWGH